MLQQAAPAKRDANRGLTSTCDLFGVMASSNPCQLLKLPVSDQAVQRPMQQSITDQV